MRQNTWRWLLLAGAIHITLTLAIFLVGKLQLLPSVVDSNGNGLTFAIDGTSYHGLASRMAAEWQTNGFAAWLAVKAPFHCRLYSVLFALLGGVVGHNTLAAEPLNLLYYLGILSCVYFLGRELFNTQAALLAAIIVGAWPSLLLHSTQLIRDPLALLCLLTLLFLLTLLLSRELSLRAGVAAGVAGAVLAGVFWIVRGNMWNVVLVAVAITIIFLLGRMIRARRLLSGNLIVILFVVPVMMLVPSRFESTTLPGVTPPVTPLTIPSATQPAPKDGALTRAIKQIGERRAGFQSYKARQSDIDSNVQFKSVGDALRFVPRATVIGFLAPFPTMWVQRGSYGLAGRLLSGVEMLVMYLLYVAAAACVWRRRQQLAIWLIFLVATFGTIALGLVVVNAGALYRLRYVFWILFIILAAESLVHLTVLRTNPTKSRMSSSVVSNDVMNRHSDVSSFQT